MKDKLSKGKEITAIWRKYETCRDYMVKKGIVERTNLNWRFYLGDQWYGMKNGETLPTMNFIKPIVKYKVSVISQNSLVANFSDASAERGAESSAVFREFNRRFSMSWEKAKMSSFSWKLNKASAVQGDSYAYFGTEDTNDTPQLIGNTSIFFGDENEEEIQNQPFIIIRERLSLKKVRKIAEENDVPQIDIDSIAPDNNTEDEIFNKDEVTDKVTSLLYLTKKDGIVHFAKTTRTCVYVPLHPLSVERNGKTIGGLSTYPVTQMRWEPQPNSTRGIGEVETIIPNQKEANKTMARRAVATQIGAYPRLAYDVNAIDNPADLDKVGKAIGVTTGNAQSINQAISYLNATNISSDANALFNDLVALTQQLAGAGDNALGNVNPERASGQAIIAVRDQAQIPLNEQINAYRQWVEDVAMLWLDMWMTFEPDSFTTEEKDTVINPMTGLETEVVREVPISYEDIVNLRPTVRIDVSEDNKWTKLSEQQSADNLLDKGMISFDEWIELAADSGPLPKAKLLSIINKRKELQEMQSQQAQAGMNAEAMNGQDVMPDGVPNEQMAQQGALNGDVMGQLPV